MKLYDIVSKAQYMQVFSIYLTNAYDQNILIPKQGLGFMELKQRNTRISTCGSLQDIRKERDKYDSTLFI